MKHKRMLNFLFCLLAGTAAFAQSVYLSKDVIEVSSRVEYLPSIDNYTANVVLELKNQGYYNEQSEFRTIEELTSRFYEKLKQADLNKDLFKEDPTMYNAKWNTGGTYQGTLFKFETNDAKTLEKLLQLRLTGLKVNSIQVETSLSERRYAELVDIALLQAKQRAETIATAIGKKITEIEGINVGDYNYYSGKSYLDVDRKEYFTLRVFYGIE